MQRTIPPEAWNSLDVEQRRARAAKAVREMDEEEIASLLLATPWMQQASTGTRRVAASNMRQAIRWARAAGRNLSEPEGLIALVETHGIRKGLSSRSVDSIGLSIGRAWQALRWAGISLPMPRTEEGSPTWIRLDLIEETTGQLRALPPEALARRIQLATRQHDELDLIALLELELQRAGHSDTTRRSAHGQMHGILNWMRREKLSFASDPDELLRRWSDHVAARSTTGSAGVRCSQMKHWINAWRRATGQAPASWNWSVSKRINRTKAQIEASMEPW